MFNPGSKHFLISDSGAEHFSSRILHKKWNANLLFLASYGFKSKVLVLVIINKDPGSEIRKKFIPDPEPRIQGVKKHRIRNNGSCKPEAARKR
jgi:hypothetical protein